MQGSTPFWPLPAWFMRPARSATAQQPTRRCGARKTGSTGVPRNRRRARSRVKVTMSSPGWRCSARAKGGRSDWLLSALWTPAPSGRQRRGSLLMARRGANRMPRSLRKARSEEWYVRSPRSQRSLERLSSTRSAGTTWFKTPGSPPMGCDGPGWRSLAQQPFRRVGAQRSSPLTAPRSRSETAIQDRRIWWCATARRGASRA